MPDGTTTVILQGKKRFEIDTVTSEDPYISATYQNFVEKTDRKTPSFLAILILSKN
jgi:ATP-dependent Lon protease